MQVPPQLLALSMHDDAVSQQARISRGMSLKYLSTNQHAPHQHAPVALRSSCDTLLGCRTMADRPPVRIQKSCYELRATHLLLVIIAIHASPRRRFCFQPLSFLLPTFTSTVSTPHIFLFLPTQPTTRSGLTRHFFLYLSEGRHRRETREAATTAGRIEHTLAYRRS